MTDQGFSFLSLDDYEIDSDEDRNAMIQDDESSDDSFRPVGQVERRPAAPRPNAGRKRQARNPNSARNRANIVEEKKALIAEKVLSAGRKVAAALIQGPWPSPKCVFREDDEPDEENYDLEAHQAHMEVVGVAIQQFCEDCIVPSMLQAFEENQSARVSYGPLIGAMLMIREVMWQNAPKIFGYELSSDSDLFTARTLATAVTVYALEDFNAPTKKKYMEAISDYDHSRPAFADQIAARLERRNDNSVANRSFWMNARRHPLRTKPDGVSMPEVNAVHVTIIRNQQEDSMEAD